MSTYNAFETDENAESGEGIVLNYGPEIGKFRVRRAGGSNRKFGKRYQALVKPHQHLIDKKALPEETSRDLNIRLYAETVLVTWEGVKDRDGNDLEFSVDNAIKLLTDLPDLFADIREVASNRDQFLKTAQKEAEGN